MGCAAPQWRPWRARRAAPRCEAAAPPALPASGVPRRAPRPPPEQHQQQQQAPGWRRSSAPDDRSGEEQERGQRRPPGDGPRWAPQQQPHRGRGRAGPGGGGRGGLVPSPHPDAPRPSTAVGPGRGFPYAYSFGTQQKWAVPTGLSVTWLGTSSGTPTRDRNISCTLLRTARGVFMVDCGEGSLVQLHKTGVDPGHVEGIFVTHMHGDHCFGLASMIAAITARRAAAAAAAGAPAGALRLYGPPGLSELLRAQLVLTGLQHKLPTPLLITELVEAAADAHEAVALNEEGTVLLARQAPAERDAFGPPELAARLQATGVRHLVGRTPVQRSYVLDDYEAKPGLVWRMEFDAATVSAAQLQHRLPCWGYVFDEALPREGEDELAARYERLWAEDFVWRRDRPFRRRRGTHPAVAAWAAAAAAAATAAPGAGGGEEDEEEGGDADGRGSEEEEEGAGAGPWARVYDPTAPPAPMPRLRPRRVVILGDTMDSSALAPICLGADLISHEATYSRGMESKALRAQHSTAWMAGQFARAVGAVALVLTHFSARYKAATRVVSGDGGAIRYADGSGGGGRFSGRYGGGGGRAGGGRGGGRGEVEEDVETDSQTLHALIGEAAGEFGCGAVCAAKDLLTVHVPFMPLDE